MQTENLYHHVHEHYGAVARADNPKSSDAIAKAFGYSEEELSSIPKDANLGLSCGNPLAIASIREGETVIDLGSGAGFDVFLAAKKVGSHGRSIGVDMNKDMLARARDNQAKSPYADSVTFVEGKITSITLEDDIADCIISNCVVNLVPEAEKPEVFFEMGRLLKSGGRVAISDILAKKQLPATLRESVAAYVGCFSSTSTKEDYKRYLEDAGFRDIVIVDQESDLNVYMDAAKDAGDGQLLGCCSVEKTTTSCCSKPAENQSQCCSTTSSEKKANGAGDLDLGDLNINEWAGSYKIFAVKT